MIKIKKLNIVYFLILFFQIFFFLNAKSELENKILVKVGNEIITSYDLQNNIVTNLILNKKTINQSNIDEIKNFSVKQLINKKIKQLEIKKFGITSYSNEDLKIYLENIAKNLEVNVSELKTIFIRNQIDYEIFLENYKIELLWNTLIFQIYNKQININLIEIENELQKFVKNQSEDEIKNLKNNLINQKKQEKLNFFSRSHYSNIENKIDIKFL